METKNFNSENYNSRNLNYIFNVEYFKDTGIDDEIENLDGRKKEIKLKEIADKFNINNHKIVSFKEFNTSPYHAEDFELLPGYQKFSLYTVYPGLLVGIGNVHEIKYEGIIKCGFSLDYTTGVPYIPGSSLKGMLRSYFPKSDEELSGKIEAERNKEKQKAGYIRSILKKYDKDQSKQYEMLDIDALREDIFNGKDTFILGCPSDITGNNIMDLEYVTPHNKGKFKNPIPIQLMKVRPDVRFVFSFVLHDSHIKNGDDEIIVFAEDKKKLFKQLILDMGIGAKTNVGFGKFSENPVDKTKKITNKDNHGAAKDNKASNENNIVVNKIKGLDEEVHCCKKCGRPLKSQPDGSFRELCPKCYRKKR